MTSSGTESDCACPAAAATFIAAGPAVVIATPGRPGGARVAVGRVARALLVARRHVPDPEPVEVRVELEVVRAGDAEDELDPVRRKAAHHELATGQPSLMRQREMDRRKIRCRP